MFIIINIVVWIRLPFAFDQMVTKISVEVTVMCQTGPYKYTLYYAGSSSVYIFKLLRAHVVVIGNGSDYNSFTMWT